MPTPKRCRRRAHTRGENAAKKKLGDLIEENAAEDVAGETGCRILLEEGKLRDDAGGYLLRRIAV